MAMEPITRREMFMAKAGGQDVNTPTPITREEMFLSKIGGSGGGNSGGCFTTVTFDTDPTTYAVTCAHSFDEVYNLIDTQPVYMRLCVGGAQTKGSFIVYKHTYSNVRRVVFVNFAASRYRETAFTEDGKCLAIVREYADFANKTENDIGVSVTWGVTT